jgi:hypothetical protein
MKAKWLIESTIFEEQADNALLKAINDQGMEYRIVHGAEETWGVKSYLDLFDKDDCVVVRGSIEFCGMVRREAPWIPGVYMTMDHYDCTNYYPVFGDSLLNGEDYLMIPYGELRRKKDWLYDKVGIENCIFIRPNRGNKIFAGKMVEKEHFDKDIDMLGFYEVEGRELCIVGRPYNVTTEFRFVVVDGKVVTGTQYKDVKGKLISEPCETPEHNWFMPQHHVDKFKFAPDRAWCIDMCMTKDGGYRVLEVGAFSCCGLYGCNTEPIVREVSRVALEEWKEYHES